jgi:predicted CopG family antitoxin
MTTTIQISDEVWKELNTRKKKGETFEDILRKLLKLEIKKEG